MNQSTLLELSETTLSKDADFLPIRIYAVEISEPLPPLSAVFESGKQKYQRVRCLVRLHTQPIGLLDLSLDAPEVTSQSFAEYIWQKLREPICTHLREDGLPEISGLDMDGLPTSATPKCIAEREAFLQNAPMASVVLSTRDRPDRLARCLPSLLSLHYPNYEILLVDNAPSTSATADLIQQHYSNEPRIRYMREDRPGLSAARNRGVAEAKGEIIAFTDDDVVVDTYWLAGLVQGFSIIENVACVTGMVLPLELETPTQVLFEAFHGFAQIAFHPNIFDLHEYSRPNPSYPYIAGACGAGAGASMAFTAEFLRSEGGFDPALGPGVPSQGAEDIVAFLHSILRGYRLVYTPASLLYHQHRRTYPELQKQIRNYGVAFTAYLAKIVIDHPALLLDCMVKFVRSLATIWFGRSAQPMAEHAEEGATMSYLPNVQDHLKNLYRVRRSGMPHGTLAYIRTRRACGWRRTGLEIAQEGPYTPVPKNNKPSLMKKETRTTA